VVSSPTSGQNAILFTDQDLAAFSEASGDRNPLHLSAEYARSTSYGEPVVFGCLGAIACLGHLHYPAGWSAASLEAEFLRPMFANIPYRVEASKKDGRLKVRLFDGSTPVIAVTVSCETSAGSEAAGKTAAEPSFEHREAVLRQEEDILPGLKVCGSYAWDSAALAKLLSRWGVEDYRLASVLCWASYVIGMELPGESALFSKITVGVQGTDPWPSTLDYRAEVTAVDSRFGRIGIEVALLSGLSTIASGHCLSYIRPPVPGVEDIASGGERADSMAGHSAVLIGSSRGLGAAIRRALEQRGAAVYGMSRSRNTGDLLRTEVGDAGDPEALRRLRNRVQGEHGRLNFLICNACPPLLPLRLESNATGRIAAYINQAVSLTLAPLAEFLELLNQSDGCVVIISSAAVDSLVKEWPHYIAAKRAVETLGCIAALQYPRVRVLIVRPPKLLTTLTNTPMGRIGAASPGLFAERIASRLEAPLEAGKTEILA
jgi:NAD(P)-dependent dehydrogenase (short-subunit alcohol dehydrogenase family)/acyl dehydratase